MSVRASLSLVSVSALVCLGAATARAETPLRGTYIRVSPDQVQTWDPAAGPMGNILYLNRCVGGCVVHGSTTTNSSLTDESTITGGPNSVGHPDRTLSEFSHTDDQWDRLVSCVQGVFEPYNITVTDVDPGDVPHHEVMVGGTDEEFGLPGALGVSPFTCTPIENSLTFVFANLLPSVDQLCWAAAQEPAHSWGLDHEMACEDPMTYLDDCGAAKYAYQDYDASCGEYQNRPCSCGQATQNSHQMILSVFGPGNLEPPELSIVRPADGATVAPQFPIEASVTDLSHIAQVELWIDGQMISKLINGPFVFNAPEEILDGTHDIEIRASDAHGAESSATLSVTVSETSGGGCSAAGRGAGGSVALILLALVAIRRRRAY